MNLGVRINPVPMFAGLVSAVLVLGTLIGQGGHAKGDSDADMSGMSMSMPGMSMPGMPIEAATPDQGSAAANSTVTLRPGASKSAGGMTVRLVKVAHGVATVQMGKDTAALRAGKQKKFADGMTVRAVQVRRDGATLSVAPPHQ
jgi:hypothetical protein